MSNNVVERFSYTAGPAGGQRGVERALEILRVATERMLRLLGVPDIADVGSDQVRLGGLRG
ncbi:alpha-hydroxy-acid oxidizing protein [Nocardia panacis]|uniref:alpha-hydroxy-acid oxidizing protein n=1 Tax=Nocardia panacis TaxID=2340916 RepID=UPI0011C4704A|nr:alpha-hydroxy-acid oxidizing protein [Nocardia panacis]